MQREQKDPDYFAICTCLVHLNDADSAAQDLLNLTKKGGDSYLIALQIAFDLASSATQEFLQNVQSHLLIPPNTTPTPTDQTNGILPTDSSPSTTTKEISQLT